MVNGRAKKETDASIGYQKTTILSPKGDHTVGQISLLHDDSTPQIATVEQVLSCLTRTPFASAFFGGNPFPHCPSSAKASWRWYYWCTAPLSKLQYFVISSLTYLTVCVNTICADFSKTESNHAGTGVQVPVFPVCGNFTCTDSAGWGRSWQMGISFGNKMAISFSFSEYLPQSGRYNLLFGWWAAVCNLNNY